MDIKELDLEHPNPEKWWKHRRRMAWLSLCGIVALATASVFGLVPEHNVPLAQTGMWVLSGVVAVYSGGASVVDAMARMRHG